MIDISEQYRNSITDVPGVLVGHSTLSASGTGCTVLLCETPSTVGVDISGGAPGTRETALINPTCYVEKADAVLLAGGSAFGLAAADGVMKYLAEQGRGVTTINRPIPIVPSAVLYDLNVGEADAAPGPEEGYAATASASADPVVEGAVGAGTGTLVGKVRGPNFAMRGGVGSASITLPNGVIVGGLAVVNAFGDVKNPLTNAIVAGARRSEDEGFLDTEKYLLDGFEPFAGFSQNTTLCIVATNCSLSKVEATRVAQAAQNGVARTVVPCRTMYDGDIVFVLANGSLQADVNVVGVAAANVLMKAILRAVGVVI